MIYTTSTPGVVSLGRMARRLGVTQRWLRAEADAGRVPCIRAERRYLFAPIAVEQALSELASGRTTCVLR